MDTMTLEALVAQETHEVQYLRTIEVKDLATQQRRKYYQFSANGCQIAGMGINEQDAGLITVPADVGAGKAEDIALQILLDTVQSFRDYRAPQHSIKFVEDGKVGTHEFN